MLTLQLVLVDYCFAIMLFGIPDYHLCMPCGRYTAVKNSLNVFGAWTTYEIGTIASIWGQQICSQIVDVHITIMCYIASDFKPITMVVNNPILTCLFYINPSSWAFLNYDIVRMGIIIINSHQNDTFELDIDAKNHTAYHNDDMGHRV